MSNTFEQIPQHTQREYRFLQIYHSSKCPMRVSVDLSDIKTHFMRLIGCHKLVNETLKSFCDDNWKFKHITHFNAIIFLLLCVEDTSSFWKLKTASLSVVQVNLRKYWGINYRKQQWNVQCWLINNHWPCTNVFFIVIAIVNASNEFLTENILALDARVPTYKFFDNSDKI